MKAFIRFECDCGNKEEIDLVKQNEFDWYDCDLGFSIGKMKTFIFKQTNPESFFINCTCGNNLEIG